MANISYNGLNVGASSNLVTFTDIPNILKITDTNGGSKSKITLQFNGNLASVSTIEPWYITILDETITSVNDYTNAVNKSFYVSASSTSTAASVARALRNCQRITANFTVEHSGNEVYLIARSIGKYNISVTTNINSQYLNKTLEEGSALSPLNGAQVNVDVYNDGEYVTTLEKNYYEGECAFDMSPLLTTFVKVGEAVPYTMNISYIKDGEYNIINNIEDNYIAQGYMVNQGKKFLILEDGITFAMNYSRGKERDVENNTILYIYGDTIPISFYNTNNGGMDITVSYLNSAFDTITTSTMTWRNTNSRKKLWDLDIPLSSQFMPSTFYVDVQFGSLTPIRFNVIKPLKAAEYYQRVYWRNSYGGISFFDFTSQRTETRDVNIETYYKNIFDYYDDPKNELEKVYNNEVKYTVTLKSHLLENDGKYIFNDMIQSPEVWTEINGETYGIIIDSCNVDEIDRNDIYEATLKYHYSQSPSLI